MIFFINLSFSQGNNYCLFGYISKQDDFEKLINFVEKKDIKVVAACEKEKLIYVRLNNNFKDFRDFFSFIEKRFEGNCYYKSNENEIGKYGRCREEFIKGYLTREE